MKFGRIDHSMLAQINWELPADPPATRALLANLPVRQQPPTIYMGCSVWTDRSFLGKIYPQGTPAKDFLKRYAQQFNTIELNTTFYSIPSIEKVKKWKATVMPGFKFCPKVPRSISHHHHIDTQRRFLAIFIESVRHFEASLGMTFMQLPPYFQPKNMETLQLLLPDIPAEFPFAIELRHPDWFSDPVAQQEYFALLRAHGVTAVITDTAGRRDVLHQTLTMPDVFIRFVGNNLHATDYIRIDAWLKKIYDWLEQGISNLYFLFHEPQKSLSVDLAVYMIQALNRLGSWQLSPPSLVDPQDDRQ